MSRRAVSCVLLIVVALAASSCARSVTLGSDEAVEVMVLDGIDRSWANCIVSALDGQIDLAKVTGLDVELEEEELRLLANTSDRCAPALAATGGVVGGPVPYGSEPGEELEQEPVIDVEDSVYRMVDEGLETAVAECLIVRLGLVPDPGAVLTDVVRLSELIVGCRAGS